MMPGGRGMNPKQLDRMMKQLGISVQEIDDVEEVIIRTPREDIVIREATVSIMNAQGSKTYQITGNATTVPRAGAPPAAPTPPAAPPGPSEEDVKLVMEQAKVDRKKAVAALEKAGGEPAQAILDLTEG